MNKKYINIITNMFEPICCKTCSNEIGQAFIIYRYAIFEYKKKYMNDVNKAHNVYQNCGLYGDLFDALNINHECCRKTIISVRTLNDLIN